MKKRFFSLLLTLVMLVSMQIALPASAATNSNAVKPAVSIKEWIFYAAIPIVVALIPIIFNAIKRKKKKTPPSSPPIVLEKGAELNISNCKINQLSIYIESIKNKNEEERNFLTITDIDDTEKIIEVICYFKLNANAKDYIVYTDYPEQYADDGNIIVYASIVNESEDIVLLEDIETQEEVDAVIEVLADLGGVSTEQIKQLKEPFLEEKKQIYY